jgi:hypothetical protein
MSFFETSDGFRIGFGRDDLPGLYMEDLSSELLPVVRAASEPGNQRMTANSFVGLLLPYHIHNINNINNMLVGVLGNAELASMFLPDNVNRAIPKVREAAESAGGVTRFLRDLSEATHPNLERAATSVSPLARLARFITLACGRSIDTTGISALDNMFVPVSRDPAAAYGALLGMATWSVLCLGGTGSLMAESTDDSVTLIWKRPTGAGEPMLPGCEMAGTVICAAGGLAGRAGCLLRAGRAESIEGFATLGGVTNAG